MTQLAAVILTILIAAWLLWRRPGAFAKRQIPHADPLARLGHHGRRIIAEHIGRLVRLLSWCGMALVAAAVLMVVADAAAPES